LWQTVQQLQEALPSCVAHLKWLQHCWCHYSRLIEPKLICNGSEGRRLRRLSTCNSPEITHKITISYKVEIFCMLLEDASWGALPHSRLLPCLYRSIWTFCRFRREIFPFPWLVCWYLSFVINICTDCAYCWSAESHHRIPKAFYWLQSVCWRPSGISKPNFVPSSSLLKFKIVTSNYGCVSFTKIVESLLENYSATCLPPDMYLLYTILGELSQFHP